MAPGMRGYRKYYAAYSELLGHVRVAASDKNRNLIDEMDSLLWLFGMMERYQDDEYLSTDWGDLSCAAAWHQKMRKLLNK